MVNITTAASALSIITSTKAIMDQREHSEQHAQARQGGGTPPDDPTDDKIQQLIDLQAKNQPSPGDKDAFSSATIDLGSGQTAEVTVAPADGYNLRVKRVHFDRFADHDYQINVGGDVTSVSHRAKYASPKLVSQSDRVLASVTNNSGSGTVVDFELEAWAEQP